MNDALIFSTVPATADRLGHALAPLVNRVRKADNGEGVIGRINGRVPDVVCIDLSGASEAGLTLARRLRRQYPLAVILAVGQDKDPDLILAGLRAGVTDFLLVDDICARPDKILAEVLDTGRRTPPAAGRLFAVYGLKGGQGKTTVAVNLADRIQARAGEKVLVVDLNLYHGDSAVYLDPSAGYSPYDVIRDMDRMDEQLLLSSLPQHDGRFHLSVVNGEISDPDSVGAEEMTAMMQLLKTHFDVVVADLPPDCSERTLAVLEAATRILLVSQQSVADIKSLQSLVGLFQDLNPDDDRVRVIINRYSKDRVPDAVELADLLGCPVAGTITGDFKAAAQATDNGRTLSALFPRKRITRDFEDLALRLSDGQSTAPPSFFGRLACRLKG